MSLTSKVADQKAADAANANAPAPAEAAPVAKSVAGKPNKTSEFKAQGALLREQMSEDQKALEGTKSDKVAFVCALGDPARKQSRKQDNVDLDSFKVVGYKLKFLEDAMVPFAPYSEDMKSYLDVEAPTMRQVKAGETIGLNLVETAMLITKVEYGGKFSGEGYEVIISAKNSQDRPDPLPILVKSGGGKGSIKETMEVIAEMVGGENGKAHPVIKPEYKDSFGALYSKKKITKNGTGAAGKNGSGYADMAAAFRNYYAQKGYNI